MRLLNTVTFKLEEFLDEYKRPGYAILSHTWEGEEVLFEHMRNMSHSALQSMRGFSKVLSSCDRARQDGYDYIWIDTCCIDKSSSAELSLAINSMWRWYRDSQICYAYLADVSADDLASFLRSRWFCRGWTLQELLAPDQVQFYDKNWKYIGNRHSEANMIAEITGIRKHVLLRNYQARHTHNLSPVTKQCMLCSSAVTPIDAILKRTSVATKMSWGKKRVTTRLEDRSYCLLGLFGVYMPLLYGEGRRAWQRLLEEIIKVTDDQSILAFSDFAPLSFHESAGAIYAPDPSYFASNIEVIINRPRKAIGFVAGEFLIELWLCPLRQKSSVLSPESQMRLASGPYANPFIGILDCQVTGEPLSSPVILLKRQTDGKFERLPDFGLLKVGLGEEEPGLVKCQKFNLPRNVFDWVTEFDEIHHMLSFDIAEAQQQHITIVNTQFRWVGQKSRALQIMPILQPRGFEYEMDSSHPTNDHGYFKGDAPGHESGIGTAIFSNKLQLPFIIIWGSGGNPWCKLWPYNQVDLGEYRNDQVSMILANALISDHRLYIPAIDRSNEDDLYIEHLRIQAKITDVSILDREICQLYIRIQVVQDASVN